MGIKNLNKFLRSQCSTNAINCIHLSELSGKRIAIDASIYMYKFESENALIENMYLMLCIFRFYNIIPIFVFDGKPPAEKKELLLKRREDKILAEKEYKTLKDTLENNIIIDDEDRQEMINSMDILKKQFIYIKKEKVNAVKDLIKYYGATYYDAPGEADELCAMLVLKKKVWGCLSEDMDMFVYGCPNVMRYISLISHTVVCYHMKEILEELGLSQKEFREICILSGTDYNMYSNVSDTKKPCLDKTLKYFKKYNKTRKSLLNDLSLNIIQDNVFKDFYDWLIETTDYIEDYELLMTIYNMFDLTKNNNHINLKTFEKIKIMDGPIMNEMIKPLLEEEGFIFPLFQK